MLMRFLCATLAVLLLATAVRAGDEDRCRAVTTCYKGGPSMPKCDRSASDTDWTCPGWVDFTHTPPNCFDSKGWDGLVNCKQYFDGSVPTTGPTTTTPTPTTTTTSTTKPSSGSHGSNKGSGSHKNAGSGSHKNAGSAGTGSGSSSNGKSPMLYYIIGGVIAIVIVAVIFLVLIRRSHNPDDDIEEMEVPPVGMIKPSDSTPQLQGGQYMQYAQASQPIPNPTTPTNRVVQYYQENAMPSPRVAPNGFATVQQAPAIPKVVHPAPSANAPTFFGSGVNAVPVDPVVDPRAARVGSNGYVPSSSAVHVGATSGAPAYPDREQVGIAAHMQATELEYPMPPQERHDSFEF